MNIINIQAAKTHLSRIVEDVVGGEEIVLAKAGKPLVKLVPYKEVGAPRKGGQLAGQIWEAPDCWDEEDLLAEAIEAPLYQRAMASDGGEYSRVAEGEAP